jgi:hypothetical protein
MDEHGTVNGRLFRKDCLMIDKCAKSDRGQQLTKKMFILDKSGNKEDNKRGEHPSFIYLFFFLILFFFVVDEGAKEGVCAYCCSIPEQKLY